MMYDNIIIAQDSIRHYSPITHEFESIFNLDNSSWNNVFSLTASKNLVAIGIGDGNYILCDVNRPSHQKIKALPRVNSTDPQAASVDYTINYLVYIILWY